MTSTPSQEERLESMVYPREHLPLLLREHVVGVLRCEAEQDVIDDACRIVEQAAAALDPPIFPVSEEKQGVTGAPLRGQALLASLPEPVPVSALPGDDPSRVGDQ